MHEHFSNIKKISEGDLYQVADLLFESDIGKKYYPNVTILIDTLNKAYVADCIYVIYSSNEIIGILWFKNDGAFYIYPYLHMLYIKESARRKGYGKELLDFLEDYVLNKDEKRKLKNKIFLVVGMWNKSAYKFYENSGYTEIGIVPSLFRKNVDEFLMIKECVKNV